jgi:hypothetical protein
MADSSKPPSAPSPLPLTPQDAMAFMQKMWNPFGVAIPGFGAPGSAPEAAASAPAPMMPFANPAMMFAALDPVEVERKIGELRVIENWLQMSLNLMQMSIKTMELQKASLEAMRGSQAGNQPGEPKPRKG